MDESHRHEDAAASTAAIVGSHTTSHEPMEVDGMDHVEDEEEEVYIVLELTDFNDHPILQDMSEATLENLESDDPILSIGEYRLHGKLTETIGTNYFYDTSTYSYVGQTCKKLTFTIAPSDDDLISRMDKSIK